LLNYFLEKGYRKPLTVEEINFFFIKSPILGKLLLIYIRNFKKNTQKNEL